MTHAQPVELSDTTTAFIVGRIESYPRHPTAGTPVEPFTHTGAPIIADGRPEVFALVVVTWATEVTTITAAGDSSTEYRTDMPGMPSGTTFHLAPVEPSGSGYTLIGGYAAGSRTAELPPQLIALGAPATVAIHDFPLR